MKIGAFASLFAPQTSMKTVSDAARSLESAGLDSLWFGEHVMLFDDMEYPYPGSADGKLPVPEGQGSPDQATLIACLVGQTSTLRFGTGISLIPQRNPIYTAKEFATLDWMSGGRIDLGVGVGWCKEEVEACGYAWSDRGERCDEALRLMQQLWRDAVVTHDGKHFTVQGAKLDPKPATGSIPLIVGGFSRAALRRTAVFGQGWLGFGLNPKANAQLLSGLERAMAEQGRKMDELDIVMMPGVDDMDSAKAFADQGVTRLVPMLDLSQPDKIDSRIEHLANLAAQFA